MSVKIRMSKKSIEKILNHACDSFIAEGMCNADDCPMIRPCLASSETWDNTKRKLLESAFGKLMDYQKEHEDGKTQGR